MNTTDLRERVEPLEGQSGADLKLFCLVVQHLGAKYPRRAAEPVGFNAIIGRLIEVEAIYARLPIIESNTEAST